MSFSFIRILFSPKSLLTLCLNGIEERKLVLVESFKGRVPERSDRKWLQVQKLSGWRVLLWQDEMAEGHWELSLTG